MKNQQVWFAVDVSLAPEAVEAVEQALSEAGAGGTEYSTLGKKEVGSVVEVVGYFDAPPDLKSVEAEISGALAIYDLPPDSVRGISAREVENRDWLAEWKKSWRPTETEKFVIAPVWSEVENTDKTIIRIEPSMAFGTGTHETTRLCLRSIERDYRPGMSFFDVGTGTGILAIAAAKLAAASADGFLLATEDTEGRRTDQNLSANSVPSAAKILACDTDEDSVKIAEENAKLNAAEGVEFYVGSIAEDTPAFDFVCANLTADVIVPLLPLLARKAEKILLLSGILREQEEWVARALGELRITNYELRTDGEWISIAVQSAKCKVQSGRNPLP